MTRILEIKPSEVHRERYELYDERANYAAGVLACEGLLGKNGYGSLDQQEWAFNMHRHGLIRRDVSIAAVDSDEQIMTSRLNTTNGCSLTLDGDASYRLDILSKRAPHRAWTDATGNQIISYDMASFTEMSGNVIIPPESSTNPHHRLLAMLGLYLIRRNQRYLYLFQPPYGYPNVTRLKPSV